MNAASVEDESSMRIGRFVRSCAILVMLAPGVSYGQSLADLYRAATEEDPSLVSAQAQLEASVQRVRQATASMLPMVAIVGSTTSSNFNPDNDQPIARSDYRTREWTFQINQPIYRPALLWAKREADTETASANEQLNAVQSDLLVRVVSSYFDILSAREVKRSIAWQKTAAAQHKEAAQHSFERGIVAITDLRDAEAKYDLLVAQEMQANNDLILKRAIFQQMIGDNEFVLHVLPHGAPLPKRIEEELPWLIGQAVAANPAAKQAQLQLEASTLDVKKARRGHYPTLDLILSYGSDQSTGTPSNPRSIYGKTMQAQASLNMPIFSGFGTDAKIKEAKALEMKARADFEKSKQAISTSVREAFYGMQSALGQIESLQTALQSARVSVLANRKSYSVGANTSADVLNAESQFSQVLRDLEKAKLEAWMNRIKLQTAIGSPWLGGINEVDALLVPEGSSADEDLLASLDVVQEP